MRINGQYLAQGILQELTKRLSVLKTRGVIPTLAIVLVGEDPASAAYVKQKQLLGRRVGGRVKLFRLTNRVSQNNLTKHIQTLNLDPKIHGIIVQLPTPEHLDMTSIIQIIKAEKDVDGFKENSPYVPPVAQAVIKILEHISGSDPSGRALGASPVSWLRERKICILGRGQTAGKPINAELTRLGTKPRIIHSQTRNPQAIIRDSDIVISCVGGERVLQSADLKRGAIVIGVGLHEKEGKLRGDFSGKDIASVASFYTPTPGGVGPVNVACLWENVVKAAEKAVV